MTGTTKRVASAVVVALAGCASAPRELETRRMESDHAIVSSAFERWRAGTGGPFELFAEHATWTIVGSSPMSRTYRSKQEFLDEVIGPFNARLSAPLVPTVRRAFADGDTVVVLFDGVAMARDGVEYRNTYAWFLRFADRRVVEVTAFFDTRVFDDLFARVPVRSG